MIYVYISNRWKDFSTDVVLAVHGKDLSKCHPNITIIKDEV